MAKSKPAIGPSPFVEKAFLAALPAAMRVEGWTMDGEKVWSITQRVNLAWRVAYEAALQLQARRRGES